MNTPLHPETSPRDPKVGNVYQFPVRARRRLENGMTVPATVYEMTPCIVDIGCWYHDEAMQDGAASPEPPKPC